MLAGVGALLVAATSCDDYLNTPPVDRLTPETFYRTAIQSDQGVVGAYAKLRNTANDTYWYLSECRSDNVWVNPQTDGFREYSEIGTFRADDDVSTFNSAWNNWYAVIYNANVAIAKIPDAEFVNNEALRNQLLGEVHFLRGWAYFELVRLFGNIPLIDTPMLPAEANTVPQSTARDIYDKIIVPDLTFAVTNLPEAKNMKNGTGASIETSGRADKIAAKAMLARVYMTMAGYPLNDVSARALAKTTLKEVLDYSDANAKKYWAPTLDEWRKQWTPDYHNKYSIFAIQFRSGGTGNPMIFNMSPTLTADYTGIRLFGNQIYVEKSLAYEFEKDNHKDGRGLGFSTLEGYAAQGSTPAYTNEIADVNIPGVGTVQAYARTIFYKFLPSKPKLAALGMTLNESVMGNNYDQWPVNFAIIRLEDIQLMYAELLVGDGDISGALKYVNDIRTRAGVDPVATTVSADEAMAFIKRERRIELLGEGMRWHDLVRWNEWKQAITNKFNSYNAEGTDVNDLRDGRYLYPIPMNQMNAVPGLYTQNQGYDN